MKENERYTITIKGPEGTEIYEGKGLLLFVQRDKGDNETSTKVIGHEYNMSLLPDAMSDCELLPYACSAVGLAIGKRLAPRPNPIEAALKAALQRAVKDEDDEDEDEDEDDEE